MNGIVVTIVAAFLALTGSLVVLGLRHDARLRRHEQRMNADPKYWAACIRATRENHERQQRRNRA